VSKSYILVIDEGTTGTRALIFDKKLNIVAQSYEEFTQYTPSEERVEHDAEEIYEKSIKHCRLAMKEAKLTAADIAAIGITNQRATSVVWDKVTGKPLYKAIVWQDSRTGPRCAELNASEWGEKAKKATGWTIAPVYSSLMLEWLLKNVPEVKKKVDSGEALFGTIDTWLVWKMTGGRTHAISYSNASVTGSLNLETGEWYKEFLDYLGVPVSIYPKLTDDSWDYGMTEAELFGEPIQIAGCIADQHAALFAQGCWTAGMAKLTNGTGSFLDVNIGEKCVVLKGGINTVIAWRIGGKLQYAMEGYAAVTGSAIQWLRDGLGVIEKSSESEALARSVNDTNGVYFVPALTGLGAPYWDPFARGMIIGITRGTTKAHICRATLEAIAFSIKDIADSISEYTRTAMTNVKIDGGASRNDLLAQFLADILDCRVDRPSHVEATSLGAAEMAGLYVGLWEKSDFDKVVNYDASFTCQITDENRKQRYADWQEAVKRSSNWIRH
jgi:glycerol kinase